MKETVSAEKMTSQKRNGSSSEYMTAAASQTGRDRVEGSFERKD